jgi:hypothetical protein
LIQGRGGTGRSNPDRPRSHPDPINPHAGCPRAGITSPRARDDMHGDEVSVYPAGTDEKTKSRNARTRTPTITAIRVHNQAAFRPIVELHHFDGPFIEGTPSLNTTSISIAVLCCSRSFCIVLARSSSFFLVLHCFVHWDRMSQLTSRGASFTVTTPPLAGPARRT